MESASNLFDRLRKKVEAQSSRGGGFYSNENLLKLKIGEKYRLRLLWIPAPKGINRENPMINQYIHRFWDNNAVGSKNIEVYCKTSQYDEGETKAVLTKYKGRSDNIEIPPETEICLIWKAS